MTRRFLLLACCICLLAGATAAATVPCDRDGDGTLTASELGTAILDSLDARFMGGTVEGPTPGDLRDAAFVHEHWDGRPLTITDSSGRTTTLSRPLRRIAVFNSDTLEMMRSIGIEPDRFVGVSKYTLEDPTFFPEYQGKANLGSIWSPDYEQVTGARPDAVFLYATLSESSCTEIEETLGSIDPGIRFFRFDSYRPAVYADEVRTLGLILGKEEEAGRFLAFHGNVTNTVAEVVNAIPAEDRVPVYLENWNDYKSAGKGSGYDEKIELAGGRNIFADTAIEYPVVDPEAVISRNPDAIVKIVGAGELVFGGYGDDDPSSFETVRRSIGSRPVWDRIGAVRDDRVYVIHTDVIGGPEYFIGVAYMAKWFYPDLFPDLDPRAIHRQYLDEFQRLDYDLDEHGTFVYPA
ncbi:MULTISPECIES: ABC transporter substrate-binding protein [unclassified Methanoculleus]|uniref:ABC transporter substrate-binding protein n=1 Tax=unclassified Methanoculleus TaxID=2619537 RepID=UPI0025FEF05B|nr:MULTISPECIES: ABC transporter substrate-binding protein [unclassified Methanoculleus]